MRLTRIISLSVLAIGAQACRDAGAKTTLAEPETISASTTVGAAPMFALSPAGKRAVAWVSAPGGGTDGRLYISNGGAPTELRDSLGPIEPHGEAPPKLAYGPDGSLYALYAVGKVVPGRRFPMSALRLAKSADDGQTWTPPVTIASDSAFGTRNFHALHVGNDGALYVAWLESMQGKSKTFLTRSADAGATWTTPALADTAQSCPCCRTAIATARDGTLYVAWRTVFPGNVRDVVVAKSTDHGATWATPVRVHADDWVFDGCPHAGPSMQVDSSGTVHIAWWTGKQGSAGTYYARSTDNGATFQPPVPLGVGEFSAPAHVQLALGPSKTVVAVWDDGTVKTPKVVMRVSHDEGATFSEPTLISSEGRAATFPVLALKDKDITIAWSEQSEAEHDHEKMSEPNMKDPKAVKGLSRVGDSAVRVRSGRLQ
ncbi:MAG TPA: sialidase family protein [Gemmatimonadaceae bacterium]|nr:sialidase family protein [Gemmatimonadaceae bacterium]